MNKVGIIMTVLILALVLTTPLLGGICYRLTDLGVLDGFVGASRSIQANGINCYGQVAGDGVSYAPNNAFVWDTSNGLQKIELLPGAVESYGVDINDSGQMVGYCDPWTSGHAFLWDPYEGLTDLGDLAVQGSCASEARAINNTGHVVGHSMFEAFYWSRTTGMVSLYEMAGYDVWYSEATDINDSDQIVGVCGTDDGARAFLWDTDNGLTVLGVLDGCDKSFATGVNNIGTIVGYCTGSNGSQQFIWSRYGGFRELSSLPGDDTGCQVYRINDYKMAVGYSFSPTAGERAVLWYGGQVVDLNTVLDETGDGWTLVSAMDINNSCQIVGYGYNSEMDRRAFLLTLIPEPGTILLIVTGGLLIRRRKLIR